MHRATASFLGLLILVATPVAAVAQENGNPIPAYCPTLSASFGRGSSDATTGGQVTQLQRFLADYYDLNPADYVSGYFGRMTQQNVMRFQKERGISPISGFVGPLTRAAISGACSPTTWYSQGTYYTQASYTPTYSQAMYYSHGTYSTNTSCSLNGQTVAHGQSVTAYQASSVTSGSTCVSQTRSCSNGTLSGSYAYASCSVQTGAMGYPDNTDILLWDYGSQSSATYTVFSEHATNIGGLRLYVDGVEVTNSDLNSGGRCSMMARSRSQNPNYICVPSSFAKPSPGTHTVIMLFTTFPFDPATATPIYGKTTTITVQ